MDLEVLRQAICFKLGLFVLPVWVEVSIHRLLWRVTDPQALTEDVVSVLIVLMVTDLGTTAATARLVAAVWLLDAAALLTTNSFLLWSSSATLQESLFIWDTWRVFLVLEDVL